MIFLPPSLIKADAPPHGAPRPTLKLRPPPPPPPPSSSNYCTNFREKQLKGKEKKKEESALNFGLKEEKN